MAQSLLRLAAATLIVAACGDDCTYLDSNAGTLCGADSVETESLKMNALPTLSATLGNRELSLLLDTGAEATVLSASLLSAPDQSYYRLPSPLCLGGDFCLEDTRVYAWDTALSSPEVDEINGIIGMDVLRHFAFKLNRGETIGLHRSLPPCNGNNTVPLKYTETGSPTADAHIDNIIFPNFLLDTGAAVCLLTEDTVSALDSYFRDDAVPSEGCTAAGCNDVFLSHLDRICIGDTCSENVETKYPAWNALGGSFFAAFNLELDFPRDTLRICGTEP